jgi:hypothetical protein
MEALRKWRLEGGVWGMQVRLETLLELYFCTKSLNFGVEAHMKALAGDALMMMHLCGWVFSLGHCIEP